MEPSLAGDIASVLAGLGMAIALTLGGFISSAGFGVCAAACRIGPIAPLRVLGRAYVEAFRNIPLLCLMVLVVFGLPDLGVLIPLPLAVVLSLALVNGANVCEALRSGVNAVPRGHIEAARALGFGALATMHLVVFPIALRATIQPLVNVFISTLLGSSLASAVGVQDLIGAAQAINLREAWGLGLFAAAAAVYSALALGAGAVGSVLERAWSRPS